MKIIDTHLHLFYREKYNELWKSIGHTGKFDDLMSDFKDLGIVGAIVMGSSIRDDFNALAHPGLFNLNGTVDISNYNYPSNIYFCMGVNPESAKHHNINDVIDNFRLVGSCKNCVGLKIYPGYNFQYPNDVIYRPYYEFAEEFGLPVVIHTGDTASSSGKLKYSHPLTVDELAVEYPRVNFVMAHFGNPWFVDAAEVAKKNQNVSIDLSGLAVGQFNSKNFLESYKPYLDQLRSWLNYLDDYSKVMYGSDWPLVNMKDYIEMCAGIIPPDYHDMFFYQNALNIFKKLNI